MSKLAAVAWVLALGACVHGPAVPAVLEADVTFTVYSPLSGTAEVARRLMTPLTFRYVERMLAAKRQTFREQSIDLAHEKFTVYVPAAAPPKDGYGLLVFIPPWPDPTKPTRWRAPLDRHGLIFVAATGSGNEASVLDRRLPLALLAYANVVARHPVDPKRVYVGGLSGGSRVAEMAALGYPDVFRGALLNAGSEPIGGESGMYLPPADLFRRFQTTRLVYVTGAQDDKNLDDDLVSQASMKDWCVSDVESLEAPGLGHQTLDADSLDRALDALERRSAIDAGALDACNARIQRELAAKLGDAEAALARGDREAARSRLQGIDRRYGGLAAAKVLELQERLEAR